MGSAQSWSRPGSAVTGRILIVDASAVARCVLSDIAGDIPGFSVVGAVDTISAAIDFVREHSVDFILLDIESSGDGGMFAIPALSRAAARANVIAICGQCVEGSAEAIRAKALGAAATIEKPASTQMAGIFAASLRERLFAIDGQAVRKPGVSCDHDGFDLVAIGSSTGGINALAALMEAVPPTADVPIVITQHLPAAFSEYFAAQVSVLARRPAVVAKHGMPVERARVIVAPGDAHVRIVPRLDGVAIQLDRRPVSNGCLPSVDPMLESAARVLGPRVLAIILSGMGRDGSLGAASVRAAGGVVLAQDRASSVVWGMPGAVANAGLASMVGTPQQLGTFVAAGRRPA